MDISAYRAKHELTQADFAARLTKAGSPATQSLVSQWEKGEVKPPPSRWAPIEQATDGEVTRYDLRPDIFGPPEAAEASQAEAA